MANIMRLCSGTIGFKNNFHFSTISNVYTKNGVVTKTDSFYPMGAVINIRTSEPTYSDSGTITIKFYDVNGALIDTLTSKQSLPNGGSRQFVMPIRNGENPVKISKFTAQLTGPEFTTHYRIETVTVVGYEE